MADVKFSQFASGGNTTAGDIVVGLRGGVNTQFNSPSGQYLQKGLNLSDVANSTIGVENLGLGRPGILILTDSDFVGAGGTYVLTNPPPIIIFMSATTPGATLQLPPQNQSTSIQASNQIELITNGGTQAININNGAATLIFQVSVDSAWRAIPNDKTTVAGAWEFLGEVQTINGSHTGNVLLESSAQSIYVSNDGSDIPAVNDGTVLFPYASLSYALSQITPTSSTPYLILMQGIFTETNLALKPWCAIMGQDSSSLTVTGSVTLDSSWSSGGELTLNHFFNIAWPSAVTLDFSIVTSGPALLNFSNNLLNGATALDIIGHPTNGAVILLENNIDFANTWNFIVNNCYGGITGGDTGNINVNHTSETAGGNFNLSQLTIEGNLTLNDTTTSAGMTLFVDQCKIIGNATYASNGSATVEIFSNGNNYFNAPILDNGTSGGTVQFIADFLTNLPVLLNGAGYDPSTIADAMVANQNFTPSAYTPLSGPTGEWVADSVVGNLAGIDAALTGLVSGSIPQIIYVDSVNGNDGTGDGSPAKPYLTYGAASVAVASSAIATNQYVIWLVGNFSEAGMILYPFVHVYSNSNASFITGGNVTLDASWNSVANPFCRLQGFILSATQVDLIFTTYQGAALEFDVNWGITSDIQVHGSATTGPERIEFYGRTSYSGTPVEYEMYDVQSYFENVAAEGDIVINNNNSIYASTTTIKNCQGIGTIFNSTSNTQDSYLFVFGSPQISTIEMQDNQSFVTIDSTSYTSQITLSGTATTANINIISLSDGVNCSTYTAINFTPIAIPGTYGNTNLTSYIAGIDAKLGSISGTPIAQQLWVNSVDGNDANTGTLPDHALQTYDFGAYPIVLANASSSNPYVVYIIGDNQVSTNFNVLPYCTVIVLGGLLQVLGTFQLDASYASTSNAFSKFQGQMTAASGISLDYGVGDGNFIVLDIDPTSTPSLSITSPNTTSNNSVWVNIIPNANFYVEIFPGGISFENVSIIANNIINAAVMSMTSTGSSNASLALQNCTSNDAVSLDSTSGPVYCQFQNCTINILNITDTDAEIIIYDDQSYPNNITYFSGATISQVNIVSGSTDGLAFSNTFTPINFSLVPGAWPSNSLTAALAGIDAQLATSGGNNLQQAYDAGTPGSQGVMNLTTDNLNPIQTQNSVRGVGSNPQRHFEAYNTAVTGTGLGFWGYGYLGNNNSSATINYAYTSAFAASTVPGSETSTWTLTMMQSGSATSTLHVNAAAQTIDTPYALQIPAGAQIFNSKLALTGSLTYSGQLLGFTNISDDLGAYTITLSTGGFSLNNDDCFYVQTQSTNAVTLHPSGGATINGGTTDFVIPIFSKATIQLVDSGAMSWYVTIEDQVSAFSTTAFPFTYDSGNSSGITGTPVLVFGTYTANGDYITANITVSLTASSTSAVLAFTAPLVSSFPIGNFISATGSVFTDTIPGFGAIGLAGVLATTTSISLPFAVTSAAVPLYVSLSFSYQYKNF